MIETQELTLQVGPRLLVDRLDWRVAAGESWCVIGPNGAGKSTLLRTLAGLRQPDGGHVELAGKPLPAWPLPALARERAYLAQSRGDAFAYRVIETVLMARHPYHADRYWEGSDDHAAAEHALRTLDVLHLAQRDVRTLSGGERQRVAIAALLAQDTPLLLLDEPANALDLAHQVAMTNLLAGLCRNESRAVVSVGHDLNLAWSGATHALLLHGDGAWRAGPVHEVMRAGLLGACLGHPIAVIEHGGRTIFLPEAAPAADSIIRRVQ
ncbi:MULTISPECIES: ABC transporter ATP-binding protein [unclassified Massilia]|uniref:ABC transporter ATP-binding protein n=1 Tax=unclassified Massilia TaxID=2609279 RepID=UPI00177F8EBE|nr:MULTISPECIES: ABC transporter ATP-binding protein [unclassified Massilia]MBD8531307.1 ABC transporter ATP-binding protein [Massilia sp. CFBP 13647]MBD8675944.1 ABC transporter ATP-binding protein [Massilia sp. CFBP 13721]